MLLGLFCKNHRAIERNHDDGKQRLDAAPSAVSTQSQGVDVQRVESFD